MTTINSALLAGLSALRASQQGLGIASQNIANANTPGYVRAEITQAPRTELGAGAGVEVTGIRRAADRFLATASYIAEAARGSSAARASILTRAQANFGDPNEVGTIFANLDQFWSALSEIGVDPSSTLRRDDAISALQIMYDEVARVGQSLQSMVTEADQRIGDAVREAQSLIDRIAELNKQIQLTARAGADYTGAENAQAALIDQLSALMDIRVTPQPEGGIHVRTGGGALLVGVDPAVLEYTPNNAPFANFGVIQFNPQLGTQSNIEPMLFSGEIAGLLQVRDQDLPALAEALGGFAGALADALNQVHNENASSPAVGSLVGRQTGLLGSDALGFEGTSIVGIVDQTGALRQRLTIDFDAGTITGEDPAAVVNFGGTISSFAAALDTALGAATPAGDADFTDGVLSLNVGGNGGLVIQQDEADPSSRVGRGFSHFFGLNDLISRPTPIFFESGVDGGDVHGFASGGEIVFQVHDAAGRLVGDRTLDIAGALVGGDWSDLVGALNTELAGFGTFSLDTDTGRIALTSASGYAVELIADTTQRGGTGVSFSALHGLSRTATIGRSLELSVDAAIMADPARLAVGRPDLSADIGGRIIEGGDNRGSAALLAARDTIRPFAAAGSLSAQTTSLATYSARLAGEAGRLSADAERSARGAAAVSTAAADRRAQIEGVSLDDELMRMTTYQNAYAAAARVIQAATEMLDVLLAIGYR
ncbi:MAG: flagellar hook-associated protein FlgK [Hyphomonadaceae bacterium]